MINGRGSNILILDESGEGANTFSYISIEIRKEIRKSNKLGGPYKMLGSILFRKSKVILAQPFGAGGDINSSVKVAELK